MPNTARVRPRDGTTSGGGLSTSTIIIIVVVCGSVFILALFLFLWRFLVRVVHRKKSAPLPPVQLLAHQRELHTASVLERKTFYVNDTDSMLGLTNGLAATPSDGSLTPGGSFYASRPNSSNPEDAMSSETISALGHPLSLESAAPLPNVNILGTGSSENLAQSPSTVLSDASSVHSQVTSASGHPTTRTPTRARPRSQVRPRPISMASSIATMQTFQSSQSRRSVIRGAPHSRHSNIHIVLPAPLAPESYPFDQLATGPVGSRSSYFFSGQDDASVRGSMASDQWVQAGARSMSLGNVPLVGLVGPVPNSSGYARTSRSLSQSSRASSSQPGFRRSMSQSRIDSSPLRSEFTPYPDQSPPPPVPQIPAEFAAMPRPAEALPSRSRPDPTRRGSMPAVPPALVHPTREASRGRSTQAVTARQESPDTGGTPPSEPRRQASRSHSRRNTLRKPRKDVVDTPP